MPFKAEPFLWHAASHVLGGFGFGGPFGSDDDYDSYGSASSDSRLLAAQAEVDETGHVTNTTICGDAEEHHSEFGVHIAFTDLYASIIFFAFIYIMGAFAQRVLKMPSLVGEIFAGIILGPPVTDYVPNPEAFVMMGEIGCVLIVASETLSFVWGSVLCVFVF